MSRGGLKFALALSVLLNLSVLSAAGYKYLANRNTWTSPFGTQMARDKFLFEELSLTPAQMQAMRQKAIPFRAEIDRRRDEIATRRKQLIELLRADKPDPAAVDAVIAQISALQQTMQQMITRQMLEQKALLDREQQQSFLNLIERAMTQGGQAGCSSVHQN